MIDRRHEKLLQEVAGGTATGREIAEVEAWLATSDEGRRRLAEIEALHRALAAVPRVTPPSSLRDGVLASIRAHAGPRLSPARPRWLLLVPAGVAAVALAVAAPQLWRSLRADRADSLSGALWAPEARDGGVLELPGARVAMRAHAVAGGLSVELQVAASGPVTLELTAPDARLAGARVAGLDPARVRRMASGRGLALRVDGDASIRILVPAVAGARPLGLSMRSDAGHAEGAIPAPTAP